MGAVALQSGVFLKIRSREGLGALPQGSRRGGRRAAGAAEVALDVATRAHADRPHSACAANRRASALNSLSSDFRRRTVSVVLGFFLTTT